MKIEEYVVDETLIKVESELVWLWVAIEPENRQILALSISNERNMLVAERFLSGLVKIMESILFLPTVEPGTQWLVIPKTKTSYSFLLGEKPYRTNYAVY